MSSLVLVYLHNKPVFTYTTNQLKTMLHMFIKKNQLHFGQVSNFSPYLHSVTMFPLPPKFTLITQRKAEKTISFMFNKKNLKKDSLSHLANHL